MQLNDQSCQAHLQCAIAAEKAGQTKDAIEHAVLATTPPTAPLVALTECARIATAAGDHARAVSWYERAVALQPSKALKFSYAVALMESGNLVRAEAEMRNALDKSPKEFKFLNLLGVVIKRAGRLQEAVECFVRAAKVDAKSASPWVNLGNCYLALGKPTNAVEAFQRACKLDPRNAENHRLLGRAFIESNQLEKALSAFNGALQRGARNGQTFADMANAYYRLQRLDLALEAADSGLRLFPGHPNLMRQRASILRRLGRINEARELFEAILKQHPGDINTLVALGNLYLWGLNQREQANEIYERALAIDPNNVDAARSYCDSLANSRYGDETAHFQKAYEVACRLLDQVPNPLEVAGTVQGLFLRTADYERLGRLGKREPMIRRWVEDMSVSHLHNQLGRVESMDDRYKLLGAHRAWGDKVQAAAAQQSIARPGRVGSSGRIRIGLMSSDLRHHPVTYFAQPVIEHYDRSRFEVYCYSFYPGQPDAVQQRITQVVNGFSVLAKHSDREIAQSIANDGIDILFELGGTTLMNRVQVCAWRPAPVQVSWLGYPHSAGLSNIDYILVDPYNRPVSDDLLIEKPFLMPETWWSLGKLGFRDLPIEPGIPQDRQGCITFGTANNPYKYTPQCFAAWAAVMRTVDGSKFLFVRPEGGAPAFCENVCRLFASHGIAADRILFEPVRGTHMPHYNRIDIALDPFPHVGGTNTCESLWMGVPVVTLAGPAFFERLSASCLHNAGLGDLCADTPDEYVRIANELASDRKRRLHLRHGLRDLIRAHPLGQPERFTRNFEAVITRTLETHSPSRQGL